MLSDLAAPLTISNLFMADLVQTGNAQFCSSKNKTRLVVRLGAEQEVCSVLAFRLAREHEAVTANFNFTPRLNGHDSLPSSFDSVSTLTLMFGNSASILAATVLALFTMSRAHSCRRFENRWS